MYSHVIFIHYINHDCHYYFPVYVDAYPAESTLEKESNRNTRPSSSKDNKLGLGWNKYDDILVFNTSDVSNQCMIPSFICLELHTYLCELNKIIRIVFQY